METIDGLTLLEPISRELDTTPDEFGRWLKEVQTYSLKFLNGVGDLSAEDRTYTFDPLCQWSDEPSDFSHLLTELDRNLLTKGMNSVSGRFMSYVPGGGLPTAAIADFLAALTNRYSAHYGACEPAVEIENSCVGWLRDLVGMPPTTWGVLTSGGTLGALTALVAARNTRPASQWERGVIYATDQAHHSIPKVLSTIGLGRTTLRMIPVDSQFRMLPVELEKQIEQDKRDGLSPWILCASAGTTNTGAVDPLAKLQAISAANGLWFHVDAAYGGFFLLTKLANELLGPMRQADSVVLDPHKGLFLPYGTGAALVKNGKLLKESFAHHPDYLHDLNGSDHPSPSDFSIEGTRHFRALRLWLSLKVHGTRRFRAALEEKVLLARYAFDRLCEMPFMEMGPYPQLSCTTFRMKGPDDRTRELLAHINRAGRSYNSSTRLNGRLFLRLCILSFRTHRAEVDAALDEVARFR